MTTIKPELTELQYFVLAQAISAAGTASHRHGMKRHAEAFHEAEKAMFRAYEQAAETESKDYAVQVVRIVNNSGSEYAIDVKEVTSETLSEVVDQLINSYPDCQVRIEAVK